VKIQFILNPASGGGKGEKVLSLLKGQTKPLGLDADIALSHHFQEAQDIASSAQRRGCEVIVACGGDGTIHSLLPALVHRPAALGVIPIGTANDLARNWKIPFQLRRSLLLLLRGRPKMVDVIRTDSGRYIAGAAGLGFDAAVVQQAEWLRKVAKGILPFSIACLSQLSHYSPSSVFLRAGDWEYEGTAWQILLTKIARYAYIFRITTSVKADNGLMDICLIPETPNLGVIKALPKIPFLGLKKLPGALFRTASILKVQSSPPISIHGDGELLGQTPEAFRVLPKALRVIVPLPTTRLRDLSFLKDTLGKRRE
jgi:diacylglycerol kinase family enzyme